MISRERGYIRHQGSERVLSLETLGYQLTPNILSSSEVAELVTEITFIFNTLPPDNRNPYRSELGNNMFRYEMLNRSAACQQAIAHPKILEVIEPLFGNDVAVFA